MRGIKRHPLAALCLLMVVVLAVSLVANQGEAQINAAAEGKLSDHASRPEDIPSTVRKDTFKASASSLFVDLTGTRGADDRSYSFGQIAITVESLAIEDEFTKGTKAYIKAQYVTSEYALLASGKTYDETTQGMGDTQLGINHAFINDRGFTLLGDAGFYLPTGSINQANPYLTGSATPHYKYFLQTGSGTIDETGGFSAMFTQPWYQLGTSVRTVIRNYDNANGYRLGNLYATNAWFDLPLAYGFTPRITGLYRAKAGMYGADPLVNRPGAELYYHDQIDWNISVGLRYSYKITKAATLLAEVGAPVAQGMRNSDNVVLDTNFYGSISAAGTF